ncbi:hypothetical protein TNCV_412891 [Trichonephila clavipes]|nr:hypothetical protein TNCV_412891 [Trichonephila clavipes]
MTNMQLNRMVIRIQMSGTKRHRRQKRPLQCSWSCHLGGIMLNRWTKLHVFDKGSVNNNRYNGVILPHVSQSRGAIEADFVLDDKERPRRSADVQQLLESG